MAHLNRAALDLKFQILPPGRLGEVTRAALFWDRGGTEVLAPLRHVPDLHLLVLCLEGRADYVDEHETRRVIVPGDLLLIPRGLAHAYRPTPEYGWSEIYVWMRGALPDLWQQQRFLGPGLSVLRAQPIFGAAQHLCRLFNRPRTVAASNDERLGGLQSWLSHLKEESTPGVAARPPWFEIACRDLAQGSLRTPKIEAVAAHCGVSYESFRKIFTLLAGTSPSQFRVAAVIERACELLRGGTMTNREIAVRLEFSDEFHFSRTFRQKMGVSPRQYRVMTF